MNEEELNDIELANLIRFYCELYVNESDPRKKKLWHRSLSLYCQDARERWFNTEEAFS